MNMLTDILSYGSTPLSPTEEVIRHFQEQEELKCDCLYLAVTLGTAHLHYVKIFQEYLIQAEKLSRESQPVPPLQGIKISIKEDSSITVSEPYFSQCVIRKLSGDGRVQLGLIRPHLVQLLRWFDYKSENFKTILNVCKLGIEAILKGYKYQQCQKIDISQTIVIQPEKGKIEGKEDEKAKEIIQVIKIQSHTSETDFVIRILENDIALLEEALKEKDERQEREFTQKLTQEKAKYFPLHDLRLIKIAQTVDEYMANQLRKRWAGETLDGIVKLFKAAESTKQFSHCESLEALIHPNPEIHQKLKLEVRELLAATLPNCSVKVKQAIEEKERK